MHENKKEDILNAVSLSSDDNTRDPAQELRDTAIYFRYYNLQLCEVRSTLTKNKLQLFVTLPIQRTLLGIRAT